MNAANKRREKDIMKLMVSDFEVVMSEHPSNSFASEFFVKFQGPKESPYEEVGRILISSKLIGRKVVTVSISLFSISFCHQIFLNTYCRVCGESVSVYQSSILTSPLQSALSTEYFTLI
jgi:hypothetical protein